MHGFVDVLVNVTIVNACLLIAILGCGTPLILFALFGLFHPSVPGIPSAADSEACSGACVSACVSCLHRGEN